MRVIRDVGVATEWLAQIAARTQGAQRQEEAARVEAILADVRKRGDAALLHYTACFDHLRLTAEQLRVPRKALDTALASLPPRLRDALELCHRRIQAFHRCQKPADIAYTGTHGEWLGRRWRPMERAGLYVPGGRAAYPSTVLMNAVPAKVAGVGQVVMVTPPGPDGTVNSTVLAAAAIAGVDEVFCVGGAQAVAGLAYGTATLPRVDVISGPGNLYVTLAKKAVYGTVAIDSLAGPSEVLVIADHTADAELLAADLLAQAEHDPMAAAILITTSERLLQHVLAAIAGQLRDHPRREICERAISDWGLAVLVPDLESAAALSDHFSPEHLELLVEKPEPLAERISQAGAIFLGHHSPEAVGDYLAGPNHTLPTSGTARFASALSVETFMRHTSLIHFNRAAFLATGPAVITLAESEGLHSHAASVQMRLERFEGSRG